jgi:hypothetical protein
VWPFLVRCLGSPLSDSDSEYTPTACVSRSIRLRFLSLCVIVLANLPLRRSARPGLLPRKPLPYRPNIGFFSDGLCSTAIAVLILYISGVSSASALSAGDDSAPDASENKSGSNDFRGVVNDGLRNCGAGVELAFPKEIGDLLDSKFAVFC